MYYGEIKNCDIANGEGVRVTLFVSGCTNRCKGCFQPQTWDFTYGQPFTAETEDHLLSLLSPSYINGLTVLGGELKSATESLIGPDTIAALSRYHFTIGFWGANGITPESGFTSPESNEALIKQLSMEHTARRYVLADATKFDSTSLVGFGPFSSATIVTCGDVPERYREFENVVEVSL